MNLDTSFRMPTIQPTSAKLARGVHGGNIEEVASTLAEDTAAVTSAIDRPTKTEMAKDVQTLKTQLWARLADRQMSTAMMTAGALLGGPHGVVLQDLAGKLHTTVASKEKLDALAAGIGQFHVRKDGDPPLADAVFQSLDSRVTGHLVDEGVKPADMQLGMLIAGAMANSYQDQGGIPLR